MFLARSLTPLSLEEIGGHFGGRDHSTVLYAVDKIRGRVEGDQAFGLRVAKLERLAQR
jgi:chromosomal replication initiator protein